MQWPSSMLDDARYAWRALVRDKGVVAVVVVTLALGVGVNAATFAVLDRLYLRPPAGVEEPAAVRRLWVRHFPRPGAEGEPFAATSISFGQYRALTAVAPDSTRMALYHASHGLGEGPSRSGPRLSGTWATASYWRVLGVRPMLGRLFTADEDRVDAGALVAVISHDFWRRRFGGAPAALGQTLDVGRQRYTIIGVLPPRFQGVGEDFRPVDVFMPLGVMPPPRWLDEPWREARHFNDLHAIQRVDAAAIAGFEQRATLAIRREAIATSERAAPDTLVQVLTGPIVGVRGPGKARQVQVIATRLGAVAVVVLVIACANVVNVLLARAVRRRREIAVRLTLGVTRARLVRLLATEAVFLAALATVVALLASWWAGEALRTMLLGDFAWRDGAVDGRVALCTLALTLLAALVSGLVPALQGSRPRLTEALKQGVREGGARHGGLRAGLVVVQSALSATLLVGAALFVRSLQNVQGLDIGFDPERLLFGVVEFDEGRVPTDAVREAALAEAAERLRAHPAVEEVARTDMRPMWGFSWTKVWIGDDSVTGTRPTVTVATPEFFHVTGLAVIQGRTFGGGGSREGEIVVNRAMAEKYWPGRSALGRCVRVRERASPCLTVVGVVETATRDRVTETERPPQYYLPLGSSAARAWGAHTLVVRTHAGERSGEAAGAALRQALTQALPGAQPTVTPMTEQLEPQYRPWRLGARLFSAFGVLALVIAMVGMYGTVSYGVSQRTHEFGVRTALGARVRDIVTLVLRQALATAVVGVALGVALALAAGRLVASLVFGISPRDPLVLGTVAALLVAMAAVAALLPAWCGAKVDPATVLRAE